MHFRLAPKLSSILLPVLAALATAAPAWAAVPGSLAIEGSVTTAAGQAAPDGDYFFTFQLYSAEKGGNLLWKEAPQIVASKGGCFRRCWARKSPCRGPAFPAAKRGCR